MNEKRLKVSKLRGEDGYRTFSVRIAEETVRELDEIAKQTNRSRNDLIGLFMQFAIDHCDVVD